MKKIRNGIVFVLFVVMIAAFIYLGTRDYSKPNNHNNDNKLMDKAYKTITTDNIYISLDSDEMLKFMDNGTGLILFCFKESLWCQSYVKTLNDTAVSVGLENIYYYDILKDRNEANYYYQKLLVKTKEYLLRNDEGTAILQVPDVYVLVNGVIIAHNNETSTVTGSITPQEYWTSVKRVA